MILRRRQVEASCNCGVADVCRIVAIGKYLFAFRFLNGKLINAGCALLYNAEAGCEIKERLKKSMPSWGGGAATFLGKPEHMPIV